MEHEERILVYRLIGDRFNEEELKELVFFLPGIEYDKLQGENFQGKIRTLLGYVERRGMDDDFLSLLKQERPDVDWPGGREASDGSLRSSRASPGFSQLALGDKTVADVVKYLEWTVANQQDKAPGALPAGMLPEIGRLFRRYSFCTPPEKCHTQVWGTRLLAVVETHQVLAVFDRYVFHLWLEEQDAELAALRVDMQKLSDAVRHYGQALTSFFVPALDWQEASSRLEADGYEALWSDLHARKQLWDTLNEEVQQSGSESFVELRKLLDGFEPIQAHC